MERLKLKQTRQPVYLDHNASTPVLPEVVEAMLPYLREYFGNPSSNHVYGKTLREAVDRARVQVASLISCAPEEVFFTSGGTEANNLAIRGLAVAKPERRHILTSVIEHPATAGLAPGWNSMGTPLTVRQLMKAGGYCRSGCGNT